MNIGDKIKRLRIQKRMTQADLAGDAITRNMISEIENGKALPSIDTLSYLANRLDVPLPFLLSDDEDTFYYEKRALLSGIKNALDEKNYAVCISLVMKLERIDDELALILADCYFNLGVSSVKNGSLQSGLKYLYLCEQYCDKTLYDVKRFKSIIPVYKAIAENVSSPLLEFDEKKYYGYLSDSMDIEFYKYLVQDSEYAYKNEQYKMHIEAKQLIKARKYADAIKLLEGIENNKSKIEYNAYLLYGVYTDLDLCHRQLFDFEGAYKYSSKRISLLEAFKL